MPMQAEVAKGSRSKQVDLMEKKCWRPPWPEQSLHLPHARQGILAWGDCGFCCSWKDQGVGCTFCPWKLDTCSQSGFG